MIDLTVKKHTGGSGETHYALFPQRLCLGAKGANRVDRLHVALPDDWADSTVRLTLRPFGGAPVAFVLDGSDIDVTDAVTGAGERGQLVLDAVAENGRVAYSAGGWYTVAAHPAAGGAAPTPTPDEWQQWLALNRGRLVPEGGAEGQVLIKQADGGVIWGDDADPQVQIGHGLKWEGGVIAVDMAADVEQDNTLPVSSAAVYTQIGNIEILLETI